MNREATLDGYVPVRPAPHEQRALVDAVRLARELGVKFQSGEIEIRWWRRESHESFGFVVRTGTKPVPVWLGTGGEIEQLISTSAHELQHARDHLDGRDTETLDNAEHYESEARAKVFAARVLGRWRAERRPRPSTVPQTGASAPAIERSSHMRNLSPAVELHSLPAFAGRAMGRIDVAKLERRRNIATARRGGWGSSQAMSDAGLVWYSAAAAFLGELLAADDMEDAERQPLVDFKNRLAARLEASDAAPTD